MSESTKAGIDRSTNQNPQELFGYLARAQKNVGPLDIKTSEGKMLKEAGWVDDRGFISEQGISKSFNGYTGQGSTRS